MTLLAKDIMVTSFDKINQEFHLHFKITGACRNHHSAEILTSKLESDTGCPNSITDTDLDSILSGELGHFVTARKEMPPVINILLRVTQDLPFPRSAGRRMYAHHITHGHAEKRKRIAFSKVL